ncbi:MAG: patatin-like phospholipase family protein [Pseudomonadota bacterium]|nr:patatin-like phospholipase family protein [Pseudomonadota bacterium]MEE3070036.1 patatin-like phospholipase family protein [Pseudomonadota bacterium]
MATKRINLALQGGGAHGAYTWGVLDRLLDEEDLEIDAIAGTSAGALNAAAYKSGFARNGRAGARETLDWLWQEVGMTKDLRIPFWMSLFLPTPAQMSQAIEMSLPYMMSDALSRMTTPYAWGPFYRNPLAHIVEQLDFGNVCKHASPHLYICATNVRTGKVKVFSGDELNCDVILASACLPTMFQAVEIEDPETGELEAYWDGGYTGNPALFPLFHPDLPDDIVIVNINPLIRDEVPRTAQEIQNRVNEISFNSSLLRDLRAISFVKRLIDTGSVQHGVMKDVMIHMISNDDLMNKLSVATKLVPTPYILQTLKEAGQKAADQFLADHKKDLNKRSTVDLVSMFS